MRIKILKTFQKYRKGSIHNLSVFLAKNLIHLGVARKEYKTIKESTNE